LGETPGGRDIRHRKDARDDLGVDPRRRGFVTEAEKTVG
jgi:hypothetical protein